MYFQIVERYRWKVIAMTHLRIQLAGPLEEASLGCLTRKRRPKKKRGIGKSMLLKELEKPLRKLRCGG